MRTPLAATLGLLLVLSFMHDTRAADAAPSDVVLGFWRTENGDGVVELYPCDNQICGRLHWLKDEDIAHPSRDDQNPDPARRRRPLCKLSFMGGFRNAGSGRYESGRVYNPSNGETYSAHMKLIDHDTLDMHGYVLTPFFGDSQIWKRTGPTPSCGAVGS